MDDYQLTRETLKSLKMALSARVRNEGTREKHGKQKKEDRTQEKIEIRKKILFIFVALCTYFVYPAKCYTEVGYIKFIKSYMSLLSQTFVLCAMQYTRLVPYKFCPKFYASWHTRHLRSIKKCSKN